MASCRFASLVSSFLTDELHGTRGLSEQTQSSYAETFSLLIEHLSDKGIPEAKMGFESLGDEGVEDFLDWLETSRDNSASTRNQRLSCLRSFARYAMRKDPAHYLQCSQILDIPFKKTTEKVPAPMHRDDMELMLKAPGTGTARALRETAIMTLLYTSGCRVSEFVHIRLGGFDFRHSTLHVTGKGRKDRTIPINKPTMKVVRSYMKRQGLSEFEGDALLFTNARGEGLTRQGIAYILGKYEKKCREQQPRFYKGNVTPHVFRHSVATHMIEDGASIIYVRDFLGHEHYETTERYAKTSPEVMRKAIEAHSKAIQVDADEEMVTQSELNKLLRKLKKL